MNFCRRRRPRVASQLSECGGAGTGCGWCVPFLRMIFLEWQSGESVRELEQISPEEYAQRRAAYIRAGRGQPPLGAKPVSSASENIQGQAP